MHPHSFIYADREIKCISLHISEGKTKFPLSLCPCTSELSALCRETYLKVDDDDDEGYWSKSRNMTFIILQAGNVKYFS